MTTTKIAARKIRYTAARRYPSNDNKIEMQPERRFNDVIVFGINLLIAFAINIFVNV